MYKIKKQKKTSTPKYKQKKLYAHFVQVIYELYTF